MKLWLALIRAELLKLKRTLALAMIFVAPTVVVALQVALLFNNKEGWGFDVDMWKYFYNSLTSLWAIFMLPLFSALVVALVYHYEHANNGWLKLFALPVPKSMIIATKQIVSTGIVLAS
ncbi:MAG: ABC transporter permease, partial [candidate division KSB1 bacterium]